MSRSISLNSVPSNGHGRPKSGLVRSRHDEEEKMAQILQLEEAVLQREEEVELLRRKGRALGGEVGESLELKIQEMMMDDPGEDVALNLNNM